MPPARQTTKRAPKTAAATTRSTRSKASAGEAAENGEKKATRRRRGEPRRLLLEAARELFSAQGFSSTSTREIAEKAGVSETLMFRYFGSKVGLFREALVAPFIEFVEDFRVKWQSGNTADLDVDEATHLFIGDLYDLFRSNRGLVIMLFAADAQTGSEIAEAGVFDEINEELRILVEIGTAESERRQGRALGRQDLATRSTIAMVAGMAVFGESFYGKKRPARKDIVDEISAAVLHGHLHRS